MLMDFTPRVITAERLIGGVVITFEDGRCALYTASLLDEVFARAEDLAARRIGQ